MEKSVRYRVRGLSTRTVQRAEAALYGRSGVHEVEMDPMSGRVWLRYDADRVPRPRLEEYLRDAGIEPVGEPIED